MKHRSMNRPESTLQQNATDLRIDRLVRVGAPLMLALSSLSILVVMLRANEVPLSVLMPMGGLAAAFVLYVLGQRRPRSGA